ncbi:transcription termination factor 4, mitochondrial [Brachionichthys hirsutus]|uniref:transcription termination factor 4, mitochondrial n=1 Tax=Brachionichthys hirsutus TaxID=412623 RepID=UPI0036053F8F
MVTLVAYRQVFWWTVRNASSTVFRPPEFWKCYRHTLCFGGRLSCSSDSHRVLQSTQHTHEVGPPCRKPETDFSLRSLADMGFTDAEAACVYAAVSKAKGGSTANHALSTLFFLGLNASTVLKILDKCPELFTVRESQLQQRIGNLRKLGLGEGSLQRMVAYFPQLLTVPVTTVKHAVMFLRTKCLFTTHQIRVILRDSPAVVVDDLEQLEYKIQYVYFRMGVAQNEMVKSRLFRSTLDKVRHRHCFLERRGLYETPDKKGQTSIVNPKLDGILNVDEDTFLTQVAMATAEEFDVFKRLLARECREEEQQQGRIEYDRDDEEDDDSDDDEEEEDDSEDEDTGGKSGYRKRRKK